MKIAELISGKRDTKEVQVDSVSLPVDALKTLANDGYENVKFYEENRTFSFWGKSCSACLTEAQIKERRTNH